MVKINTMKGIIIVLVISCLLLYGCTKQNINISDQETIQELEEILANEHYPYAKNLKILQVDEFQGKGIALYSFDFTREHYVGYTRFIIKGNKVENFGGSWSQADIANNKLSYSTSSASDDKNNYYLIAYGEVNQEATKKLRAVYTDGSSAEVDVINNSYFLLSEGTGKINWIKTIEGLDASSNTTFVFPNDF